MVSTFFFTLYPEKMRMKEMYNVFKRYGDIDEVVILAKRGVWGRMYGLVRFFIVKDERPLTTKLDNTFLGNQNLFVNPLRFARTRFGTTKGRVRKEEDEAEWKEKSSYRFNQRNSEGKASKTGFQRI